MAGRLIGSAAEIIANLQQAGGYASRSVNNAMQTAMEGVRDEAKARVPVEHGNMESAITLSNDGYRKSWSVFVDESVPDHSGRYTVGDYVYFLHEAQYNLGSISRDKAAANGKPVGRKFLENPFKELVAAGLIDNLQHVLNEALANRGK